MTDYKKKKPKTELSKPDVDRDKFFTKRKVHFLNEDASIVSKHLESDKLIQKHSKFVNTFRPIVKAKDPSTFCFYGSAEKYYEDAQYNIINYYPFDGTREEVLSWYLSSSQLDTSLLNQYWPGAVGHAIFNYSEYLTFYAGPQSIPEMEFTGNFQNGETGLRLDPSKGNTIEFWMKKDAFNTGSYEKETILEIGTYPGKLESPNSGKLSLFLSSSTGSPFRLSYSSGSVNVSGWQVATSTTDATVADSEWHHYAFRVWQEGTKLYTKSYVDGQNSSIESQEVGNTMGSIDTFMAGAVGAQLASTTPTLSASLDDLRFWKGLRSAREISRFYDQKVYASLNNQDDYTSRLGLSYRFNKNPVSNSSVDSLVIDYSGNEISGRIKNYNSSSRVSTSAITLSPNTVNIEVKDPVLAASDPVVKQLALQLQEVGQSYDITNNSLLKNFLPEWTREENSNHSEFEALLQMLASEFDTIKSKIDAIRREVTTPGHGEAHHFTTPQNPESSITSSYRNNFFFLPAAQGHENALAMGNNIDFARYKIEDQGVDYPIYHFFSAAEPADEVESIIENTKLEKSLDETRKLINENLAASMNYILSKKGTEQGFDATLAPAGLDRFNISYNIIPQNAELLIENQKTDLIIKAENSLYLGDNNESVIYMSTANADERSYLRSDTQEVDYTFEGNFMFPNKPTDQKNLAESSIFGLHEVANSNNDLTFSTPDNGSFQISIKRGESSSRDATFFLTSSTGLIPSIESPICTDVFGAKPWNLSLRIYRDIENTFVAPTDSSYKVEFSGNSFLADTLEDSFAVSSPLTQVNYNKFLAANKTVYIGAHRVNITGSTLLRSEIKVLDFNAWNVKLSDQELLDRGKFLFSYGRSQPHMFESTALGDNKKLDKNVVFRTQFSSLSSNPVGGIFSIADMSSGSLTNIELYGDLLGYKYPFKTTSMSSSTSQILQREHLSTTENVAIDNLQGFNAMTTPLSEINKFGLDSRPELKIFSFEKSMYRAISREMAYFMGGVKSYNNLIGEPVNKYRKHYKLLDHLRSRFFEMVENENQFERYVSYYRWVDKTIGEFLNQLIPASSMANTGIENVVESHALERNKYDHKYTLIETKAPDLSGQLLSINELLYDWEHGNGSISGQADRNCLWQKDRKERDGSPDRESIRKIITTVCTGSNPGDHFHSYVLRNLARPYKHTVTRQNVLSIGSNSKANKIKDFYKIVNDGRQITLKAEDIFQFRKCDDVTSPAEKRKYTAKIDTSGTSGYLDGDADLLLPFTIYSSSAGTDFNSFKEGMSIRNNHDDISAISPSPWISENFGGMPHRRVKVGTPHHNRPEAYDITHNASQLTIKATTKQKSMFHRDLAGARFYNFSNVKTKTSGSVLKIGNYEKDYEIVQTNSRALNNNYLVEKELLHLTGGIEASTIVSGTTHFYVPPRDKREHVFVNRFSSPGAPDTTAAFSCDRTSGEFSIYNSINYRNSIVRNLQDTLSAERSERYGFRSSSATQASIHKTNRNYLHRHVATGTLATPDNLFVQHQIPQNDFGYSWITASSEEPLITFLSRNAAHGHQHLFDIPGVLKSSETILFLSSSEHTAGLDFNNLNTYVSRSVDSGTNLLTTTSENLNNIILNNQGPYGWPTWKQIRGGDHPVTCKHNRENILSVVFRDVNPRASSFPGSTFDYVDTTEDTNSRSHQREVKNYEEMFVTNRFRPLTITIHPIRLSQDSWTEGDLELSMGLPHQSGRWPQSFLHLMWFNDEHMWSWLNEFTGSHGVTLRPSVTAKATVQNNITGFANMKMSEEILHREPEFLDSNNLKSLNDFCNQPLSRFTPASDNVLVVKELNYLEKVYPREVNTYTKNARTREKFDFFGWDSKRANRNLILTGNLNYGQFILNSINQTALLPVTASSVEVDFKLSLFDSYEVVDLNATSNNASIAASRRVNTSTWVLDSRKDFSLSPTSITRSYFNTGETFLPNRDQGTRGEGVLQNDYSIFALGYNGLRGAPPFSPVYNRRIPQLYSGDEFLSGEAKSEPADSPVIRLRESESLPHGPFFDNYATFAKELKYVGQQYSLIPEYTVSRLIEDIHNAATTGLSAHSASLADDFLQLTGAIYHSSSHDISIGSQFFKTYSTSDFMKYFLETQENIEANTPLLSPSRLTLRCKAAKRFLPYRGFYPAERVVQLSEIFHRCYLRSGSYIAEKFSESNLSEQKSFDMFGLKLENCKSQALKPLLAPGVLLNSIKTGLAVDYPIFSSSVDNAMLAIVADKYQNPVNNFSDLNLNDSTCFTGSLINSTVDQGIPRISGSVSYRVTFDDVLNPANLMNKVLYDNEPHPSASSLYGATQWLGVLDRPATFGSVDIENTRKYSGIKFQNDDLAFEASMAPFQSAVNNFCAETVKFFLKDGKLNNIISKPSAPYLSASVDYKMKIYLVNYGTEMYDRHSAFGPPVDEGNLDITSYSETTLGSTAATKATLSVTFASPTGYSLAHITASADLPSLVITDQAGATHNFKFYDSDSSLSVSSSSTTRHVNLNGLTTPAQVATALATATTGSSIEAYWNVNSAGSLELESNTAGVNANISASVVNSSVTEGVYIVDGGDATKTAIVDEPSLSWSSAGSATAASSSIAMNDPSNSKIMGAVSGFYGESNYPWFKVIDESGTARSLRFYDSNSSYMQNTTPAALVTYVNLYDPSGGAYKTTSQLIASCKSALEAAIAVTVAESPSNTMKITLDTAGVPSTAALSAGNCFLNSSVSPCSSGTCISTDNALSSFAGGAAGAAATSTLTFLTASSARTKMENFTSTSNLPSISLSDGDGTTHSFRFYNTSAISGPSNTTSITYIAISGAHATNAANFDSAVNNVGALNISSSISSHVVTLSDTTTGSAASISASLGEGENLITISSSILSSGMPSWSNGTAVDETYSVKALQTSSAPGSASHGFLPYVPPFLDPGTAPYAEISFVPDASRNYTIPEIVEGSKVTYYNIQAPSNPDSNVNYKESMSISASVKLKGYVKLANDNLERVDVSADGANPVLRVQPTSGHPRFRWEIQTTWEAPVMGFHNVTQSALDLSSSTVVKTGKANRSPWKDRYQSDYYTVNSAPTTPYLTSSRGMWHQRGELLREQAIRGYHLVLARGMHNPEELSGDLSAVCGFNRIRHDNPKDVLSDNQRRKLGVVAKEKVISEAVVAIPYWLNKDCEMILLDLNTNAHEEAEEINKRKKAELRTQLSTIRVDNVQAREIQKYEEWSELTGVNAKENIAYQLRMMDKYVLPTHFDFNKNLKVNPHVQYFFQFKSRMTEKDLALMWQNIYPGENNTTGADWVTNDNISVAQHSGFTRGTNTSEILSDVEFISSFLNTTSIPIFSEKESNFNTFETFMKQEIRWLVFKVKQRAHSDYFELEKESITYSTDDIQEMDGLSLLHTDTKSPGESQLRGLKSLYSYNWPYDYFSIVELAEIESKVDFYETHEQIRGSISRPNTLDRIPGYQPPRSETSSPELIQPSSGDPDSYWGSQGYGQSVSTLPSAASLDNLVVREVVKADVDSVPSPANQLTVTGSTIKSGTESIYINGILQTFGGGNDYTVSSNTITFAFDLESTDSVQITYVKE